MSQVYITNENDMLDQIAFKIYQDESKVVQILDVNPGLVDQPEMLPFGIEIVLPIIPDETVDNVIQDIWS